MDQLLADASLTTKLEVSPQSLHSIGVLGDLEARFHSPGRSSVTDEDSGDGESVRRKRPSIIGVMMMNYIYIAHFSYGYVQMLYIEYYVITYFILTHPPTFPVGGNRSARRKPTTFGRALAYSFHMRNSKSPDGESNPRLRGERRWC